MSTQHQVVRLGGRGRRERRGRGRGPLAFDGEGDSLGDLLEDGLSE